MQVQPGDLVILDVPDNPRLHEANAIVTEPTEWGAHVGCSKAATGHFRALHEEMRLIRPDLMLAEALTLAGHPVTFTDEPPSKGFVKAMAKPKAKPKAEGYTGGICEVCQGCRLVRTGTCVTCQDCGNNEGCG